MLSAKSIERKYKGHYIEFYKDETNEFWFPMSQIMAMLNIYDFNIEDIVDILDKGQYRIEKIDGVKIALISIHGLDYFEKHEYQKFPFFDWLRRESVNMYNLFQWLKCMGECSGETRYLRIPDKSKKLLADLIGLKTRDIWG